jgi:hypothetical protein
MILVGPGDSLHVVDLVLGRVTIVRPDLEVGPIVHAPHPPTLVQPDGSFIVAQQIHTPENIGYPIHLVDRAGRILRSFGADTPQYRRDLARLTDRIVAPSHDGSIWAVPPGRYVIERWDVNSGQKLTHIDVQSTWFRESANPNQGPEDRPDPIVVGLWESDDGLIWILLRDADSDWQPPTPLPGAAERAFDIDYYSQQHDWVIEVVDTATGRIIASRRFPNYLGYRPPTRLLVSLNSIDVLGVVLDVWQPVLQPAED